jgi:hypothetical protein
VKSVRMVEFIQKTWGVSIILVFAVSLSSLGIPTVFIAVVRMASFDRYVKVHYMLTCGCSHALKVKVYVLLTIPLCCFSCLSLCFFLVKTI